VTTAVLQQRAVLPWTEVPQEERRFRRILVVVFTSILLLSIVIPWVQVPHNAREEVGEVPERFARLMVQEPPKPPPPPVVEQPKPEPAPEAKPEPEPEKKVEEPKATEERPEVPDRATAAREKASRTGLLALRSELADLKTDTLLNKLERQPLRKGTETAVPEVERSIITSQVASGSGGIDTRKLSRDTGGTQLATRTTTRVETPQTAAPERPVPSAGAAPPPRTTEEVQIVFDQNKGPLNALYNRALRLNPTLAGKVVLRITIDASGAVTECTIESSELHDPELEHKLVARIKLFNFGAKRAALTTVTYPIDFFPG
jgi:protein TonB